MPNDACCNRSAWQAPESRRRLLAVAAPLLLGAACAPRFQNAIARPEPPAAPLPRAALPLDDAVVALADATLEGARTAPQLAAGGRRALVIDPLIDRASGAETNATRSAGARIATVVRDRYPELDLQPFTLAALEARPLILLGAITRAQEPGSLVAARGPSDTYRIWAVLGDLRTGLILAHPTAWVRGATVDATPVAFHRDSPAWVEDEMVAAYLRTCAGDPGTAMDPVYLRGLRAQAAVAEAVSAQERGDPARALSLYQQVAEEPGGQQARALNGIYLAQVALGRPALAEEAFGELMDHGLARGRLAMRLLFRPGGTAFVGDPALSAPYPMWLRRIADRTAARGSCLEVVGHTSITGSAAANERLSLARARTVQARLVALRPELAGRVTAAGRGEREPIIGSGTDDLRDALDRRVEFRPVGCAGLAV